MREFFTTSSFFFLIVAAGAQEPAVRLRVPDASLQTKARAAIQDVFGAEIAKAKTATTRRALAAKMLVVANDPNESAGNRWVLYTQARDLSAAAGDMSLLVQALDDLTKTFAVNRRDTCSEAIEKVKLVPAGGAKPLVDLISCAAEDALNADEYNLAVRILGSGVRIANLGKEPAAARRFESRIRTANEQAKLYELSSKGDDEALGRFLCLRKGDWAKGLPLLMKSKDEELAQLARKDRRNPKEAKDQADLGIAWLEFGEKTKGAERVAIMKRAIFWGQQGAEGLTGLAKAKVEQRMSKAFAEIDDADAKEGLFTLYAGEWAVKYSNGYSRDYSIDVAGKVTATDNTTGTLSRSKGELLYALTNGRMERIRLVRNSLEIDHYAAGDYPNKVESKGVGTPKK